MQQHLSPSQQPNIIEVRNTINNFVNQATEQTYMSLTATWEKEYNKHSPTQKSDISTYIGTLNNQNSNTAIVKSIMILTNEAPDKHQQAADILIKALSIKCDNPFVWYFLGQICSTNEIKITNSPIRALLFPKGENHTQLELATFCYGMAVVIKPKGGLFLSSLAYALSYDKSKFTDMPRKAQQLLATHKDKSPIQLATVCRAMAVTYNPQCANFWSALAASFISGGTFNDIPVPGHPLLTHPNIKDKSSIQLATYFSGMAIAIDESCVTGWSNLSCSFAMGGLITDMHPKAQALLISMTNKHPSELAIYCCQRAIKLEPNNAHLQFHLKKAIANWQWICNNPSSSTPRLLSNNKKSTQLPVNLLIDELMKHPKNTISWVRLGNYFVGNIATLKIIPKQFELYDQLQSYFQTNEQRSIKSYRCAILCYEKAKEHGNIGQEVESSLKSLKSFVREKTTVSNHQEVTQNADRATPVAPSHKRPPSQTTMQYTAPVKKKQKTAQLAILQVRTETIKIGDEMVQIGNKISPKSYQQAMTSFLSETPIPQSKLSPSIPFFTGNNHHSLVYEALNPEPNKRQMK